MLFCRDIKICRDLRNFGNIWAKKLFFRSKTVFLGQLYWYIYGITWYILHIMNLESILKFACDFIKKCR